MVQDMSSPRFISALTKNNVALALARGRGSRLHNLTDWNAKPAVQFGGKFRIIDFPLTNCINPGIRRIGVVTQYTAHTLIEHIQKGWGFLRGEFNEFVALLPVQQRIQEEWYRGTADAVFQNIDILRGYNPEYIVILAGDHVYKMDYGEMLAAHVSSDADMTVGCVEMPATESTSFGVMSVDDKDRIVKFSEKPANTDEIPGKLGRILASMGIYVFNARFLYEQLIRDADTKKSSHDFGHDLIPYLIDRYRVYAHRFEKSCVGKIDGGEAYWRDVGNVDASWQAHVGE